MDNAQIVNDATHFTPQKHIYLDAFTTKLLKIWIIRNSQLLIDVMLMANQKLVALVHV